VLWVGEDYNKSVCTFFAAYSRFIDLLGFWFIDLLSSSGAFKGFWWHYVEQIISI